ncbi:hypothetical protein GCM10023094_09640 [Rhodococcus olei]|uniref:Antitoxin Xre/MbcA/ParS-like toxin-binding domain-containing protein n=1 Tax=Rhodococcus olei TaxID=2161675 RepID=A0ABP8NXV5_9NOCA
MAADVLSAAGAAHDPSDAAATVEAYAAEIAATGADHAVRSNLTLLTAALHKVGGHPALATRRRAARAVSPAHDDLVAVFTELGMTTLTEQQRLQLAQDLIGTVTGRTDSPRERARATGRESILDSFEHLDSMDISHILAPTSAPTRSVAQKRRKAGDLIGLPVGTRPDYRYPAFQLDRTQHRIHPLVRHANKHLDVDHDPYGAASWWLTPTDILDGRTPLEDLEAGDLTEMAIDNVLDTARRGM